MRKKTDGVTLIALTITVVVLLIIAGISFSAGKEVIQKAQIEELKTNMLLIQAKAKEYVEEATFRMGINPDDVKKNAVREEIYGNGEQGAKLQAVSEIPQYVNNVENTFCYWLTPETQVKWGLDKIKLDKDEKYLIQFDENKLSVEVYNTKGYDGKYSLTDIENLQK